jgi:hypothetical protein
MMLWVANLTGAGWTAVYSVNGDPHNIENVRAVPGADRASERERAAPP